jgi:hypothetical protein
MNEGKLAFVKRRLIVTRRAHAFSWLFIKLRRLKRLNVVERSPRHLLPIKEESYQRLIRSLLAECGSSNLILTRLKLTTRFRNQKRRTWWKTYDHFQLALHTTDWCDKILENIPGAKNRSTKFSHQSDTKEFELLPNVSWSVLSLYSFSFLILRYCAIFFLHSFNSWVSVCLDVI